MSVENLATEELDHMEPIDYVVIEFPDGRQPPLPTDARDKQLAQLKELGELKAQGVITDEEFAAQKAQILGA